MDILFRGDYGGGYFQAVVKIIVRDDDGEIINSNCHDISYIKCKKDSYYVLQEIVGKDLKDGICSILKEDEKTLGDFLIIENVLIGEITTTFEEDNVVSMQNQCILKKDLNDLQ